MVAKLSISISDFVFEDLVKMMLFEQKTNTSEFIEEMIRLGILEYKKKKEGVNNDEKMPGV